MNAGYYNFADEPGTQRKPNGHAGGDQPIDWPEPIDILADPQLTGLASVDATCLPALDPHSSPSPRAPGLQVDPCHIAALTIGAMLGGPVRRLACAA